MAAVAIGLVLGAERQARDKREQVRLRQENEALRLQLARLKKPAGQPARPEVNADELERLRHQEREVLRLRGEVNRLRRELPATSSQSTNAESSLKARLLADASKAAEAEREEMGRHIQSIIDEIERKMAAQHAQDLRSIAETMVATNPVAAIEFTNELSHPEDIRPFLDAVFAAWAAKDTEAALNWVEQQVSDPGEREADIRAIQSAAAAGAGAARSP